MKTLVADIGGTNSRLAVALTSRTDKEIILNNVQKFKNADFNDFEEVIEKYLSILDDKLIVDFNQYDKNTCKLSFGKKKHVVVKLI